MNTLVLLIVLLSTRFSDAAVEFSHSTIYDIYDFVGKTEVSVNKCDNGCYIYASTQRLHNDDGNPSNFDQYASKLIITVDGQVSMSLAQIAMNFSPTTVKIPAPILKASKVKIVNQNGPQDKFNSLAVYVVDYKTASVIDFNIYDAYHMEGGNFVNADITTIMSAVPFTVTVDAADEVNSVKARLVGIENAQDSNNDGCPIAFQTPPNASKFAGLNLQVVSPIISLIFEVKNQLKIGSTDQFSESQKLSNDGVVTSPGWNGCKKMPTGIFQIFRSPVYLQSYIYHIDADVDESISLHLEAELNNKVALTVTVDNEGALGLSGTGTNWGQDFDSATTLTVAVPEMSSADQGFIFRHTARKIANPGQSTTTTALPTTSGTISLEAQSVTLLLLSLLTLLLLISI